MASHLLRLSLSSPPKLCFNNTINNNDLHFISLLPPKRRCSPNFPRREILRPHFFVSNSFETEIRSPDSPILQGRTQNKDSPVLLDVTGMMCGACVARVKNILSADERVDSVVVNMLTETAAVKLRRLQEEPASVAESLAQRLSDCGFPTKRRVTGSGVAENVRKWRELVKKKEELVVKSRSRVAFAWILVALCCGTHASHIFHSLGIHNIAHGNASNLKSDIRYIIQHLRVYLITINGQTQFVTEFKDSNVTRAFLFIGPFWEILHNSYLKGGLALGSLLGPGRG